MGMHPPRTQELDIMRTRRYPFPSAQEPFVPASQTLTLTRGPRERNRTMTQPRPQIRKAVIHLLGDAFHCVNRANEPERARLYAEVLDGRRLSHRGETHQVVSWLSQRGLTRTAVLRVRRNHARCSPSLARVVLQQRLRRWLSGVSYRPRTARRGAASKSASCARVSATGELSASTASVSSATGRW